MSAPPIDQTTLDTAVALAQEAGRRTLRWFRSPDLEIEQKGDGTPVTAADKDAERFLREQLAVAFPGDGVLGCAVAEELEKLGVNLTVHTVGFGLDNEGAVGQLKCLAEKTGGTYSTADNASELQGALTKTVEAKAPEPAPEILLTCSSIQRLIDLDLAATDRTTAEAEVRAMCERLLANTVIEKFTVEIA